MKSATIELIETMDNFRLLRFFSSFCSTLFNNVDADVGTIIDQLPQTVKNIPEMQTIVNHEEKYSMPIEHKEAVQFARTSLLQLANDENIEPALAEAINNYRDDEMPAGVILALGGVVSFILLLSTSHINYVSGKGWDISLGGDRKPEEIKAIEELLKQLFEVIPNSILKIKEKINKSIP